MPGTFVRHRGLHCLSPASETDMNASSTGKITAALIGLCAAGAGVYWYQNQPDAQPLPSPATNAQTAPTIATTPALPSIQHPVPPADIEASEEPLPLLPALQDSDGLALETLVGLFNDPVIADLLRAEFVIPRVVSTVDNLPRDRLNTHAMPIKPVPGVFAVSANGDEIFISDANAARYQKYVDAFVAVDTAALVVQYRRLYPLFQRAYVELGDPNAYFNDRLIVVIDHMLQAPIAPPPVALVKPRSTWEYADPEQQSQSVGHRLMMRIGAEHSGRLKAKLTDLRAALLAP